MGKRKSWTYVKGGGCDLITGKGTTSSRSISLLLTGTVSSQTDA